MLWFSFVPCSICTSFLTLLTGFCCAEELVTGLSRVSWEKVDVSFHSIRQRFAAHSIIQVPSLSPSSCFPNLDLVLHSILSNVHASGGNIELDERWHFFSFSFYVVGWIISSKKLFWPIWVDHMNVLILLTGEGRDCSHRRCRCYMPHDWSFSHVGEAEPSRRLTHNFHGTVSQWNDYCDNPSVYWSAASTIIWKVYQIDGDHFSQWSQAPPLFIH